MGTPLFYLDGLLHSQHIFVLWHTYLCFFFIFASMVIQRRRKNNRFQEIFLPPPPPLSHSIMKLSDMTSPFIYYTIHSISGCFQYKKWSPIQFTIVLGDPDPPLLISENFLISTFFLTFYSFFTQFPNREAANTTQWVPPNSALEAFLGKIIFRYGRVVGVPPFPLSFFFFGKMMFC